MPPLPIQFCFARSFHRPLLTLLRHGCLAALTMIVPIRANAQAMPDQRPPASTAAVDAQVRQLLPATLALLQTMEAMAIARGRALTHEEMQTAHGLGVAEPERVRVLVTPVLPSWLAPDIMANGGIGGGTMASNAPADEASRPTASNPNIPPEHRYGVAGLTAGHGILLGIHHAHNPRVLAHELAHVAQYERLGMCGFALRYLTELLSVGYYRAPLEREADAAMRRVLASPQ